MLIKHSEFRGQAVNVASWVFISIKKINIDKTWGEAGNMCRISRFLLLTNPVSYNHYFN